VEAEGRVRADGKAEGCNGFEQTIQDTEGTEHGNCLEQTTEEDKDTENCNCKNKK
jgi:hypothetical protein